MPTILRRIIPEIDYPCLFTKDDGVRNPSLRFLCADSEFKRFGRGCKPPTGTSKDWEPEQQAEFSVGLALVTPTHVALAAFKEGIQPKEAGISRFGISDDQRFRRYVWAGLFRPASVTLQRRSHSLSQPPCPWLGPARDGRGYALGRPSKARIPGVARPSWPKQGWWRSGCRRR